MERHNAVELGAPQSDQRLLRDKEATLRIEHLQKTRHTILISSAGKPGKSQLRIYPALLRSYLLGQIAAIGKRIRHFAKCNLDSAFRGRDLYGFAGPGDRKIALACVPERVVRKA